MKFQHLVLLSVFSFLLLSGCIGNMNPTGGNSSPDYPYFVTVRQMVVKKLMLPAGTTLTYEEQFLKTGKQDKIMSEDKLTSISFPKDKMIYWGGVPITSISKFFNTEMSGFTVSADFERLSAARKTKFAELWESCSDDLGITVKSTKDWSFNKKNIADVESCSVLNQRYFKDDAEQQGFLNSMFAELQKIK